jgi:hypothetical protein
VNLTRPRVRRPGPRGWPGRGGGSASYIPTPVEARGTSVQVCGLWPWAIGANLPPVGAPVGHLIPTGWAPVSAGVLADPVSWFQAGIIRVPSEFVLGLNGYGKSTLVRKQCVGSSYFGVHPVITGDLKPDYVKMVQALDGQIIALGRGRGYLNYLDVSYALEAAARLMGAGRAEVLADAHGRRTQLTGALLTILRHAAPADWEESIIDRALRVLDDRHKGTPVNLDLLRIIREGPEDVRQVAVVTSDEEYRRLITPLERSLLAMEDSPRLGHGMFCRPTTEHMLMDRAVAFDISSIPETENDLAAAALLACSSYAFGVINTAHALTDAGLEPRHNWLVVQDELWRPMRVGHGMVARLDALSRLDRSKYGVGQIRITHTMSDLELPDPAETAMARGFVERSGMLALGPLPWAEMEKLAGTVRLSHREQRLLTSWTAPGAYDRATGRRAASPGQGNFMFKVGEQPGIPAHVVLSEVEEAFNDTNTLWDAVRRVVPDAADAQVAA